MEVVALVELEIEVLEVEEFELSDDVEDSGSPSPAESPRL